MSPHCMTHILRSMINYIEILCFCRYTGMLSALRIVTSGVRVKRIRYLSPMRAAKVQASLRIRAVSPEPPLLAHTSIESRGTFSPSEWLGMRGKICHDGMLEDTDSLDGAQWDNQEARNTQYANTKGDTTIAILADPSAALSFDMKRHCKNQNGCFLPIVSLYSIIYDLFSETKSEDFEDQRWRNKFNQNRDG